MKNLRLRFVLLTIGVMAAWHTSAQDIDIDALSKSVATYTAEISNETRDAKYYENLHRFNNNFPSLKFNNSLQVGAGAPGLILSLLFWEYGYDKDTLPSFANTFSEKLAKARFYDTPTITIPALAIDYHHNVKRWLGLGVKGVVGFETMTERHVGTNKIFRRNSRVVTTALFDMRFSWLHRNYVSMYSSLGLGFSYQRETTGYSETIPMIDVTWVGLHVGQRVYGFVELGGFIGGVVRGGIGVRF